MQETVTLKKRPDAIQAARDLAELECAKSIMDGVIQEMNDLIGTKTADEIFRTCSDHAIQNVSMEIIGYRKRLMDHCCALLTEFLKQISVTR